MGHTWLVDDILSVTFVRHNEANNMRAPTIGWDTWIMLLAFPLDYQTTFWLGRATAMFGKLRNWSNPRADPSHVLARVWIKNKL